MDDLLALMEEGDNSLASERVSTSSTSTPQGSNTTRASQRPTTAAASTNKKKKAKKNASVSVDTQVDHRLGIRMTQRNMGSLDMLDLMASSNYHSCSALAAMSLEGLNQQVLLEPTPVLDVATVCGRTNLLTIGVVFVNSGTKIASSGKAFCFLTIGSNLQSGPSVSVLLFGPAYSKFCQSAKPGLVVAVTDPRLIPPKPNDNPKKSSMFDTSISFSINDERQLTIIAKARDYGVCQAMVKGKNAQGHWVNNARRCPTAIDTRVSKFCQLHRKLENVKPDAVNNNSKKGTFMQQQRQELNRQPLRRESTNGRNGVLILPNNKGNQNSILTATPDPEPVQAGNGRLQGVPKQMVKGAGAADQMQQSLSLSQKQNAIRRTVRQASNRDCNNGILNPKSKQAQSSHHAPRAVNMNRPGNNVANKATTNRILNPSLTEPVNTSAQPDVSTGPRKQDISNPYASKPKSSAGKEQKSRTPVLQNSTNQQPKKRSNEVLGDWLSMATERKKRASDGSLSRKSSSSKTKKGTLNTMAMGGFDGQVPVPKPAKIFATTGAKPRQSICSRVQERQQGPTKEDILAKQHSYAQQLETSNKKSNANSKSKITSKSTKKPVEKSASFFDSLSDSKGLDREAIANAKSRFATEADAEAYALSRRRVTELEAEESRKESSKEKKKTKKDQQGKVIGKEWFCRTCNQRSKYEPRNCIRAHHDVVSNRILNKAIETKEDKRVKLNAVAVEDGGITLGSGLEWSRFRSSRFS